MDSVMLGISTHMGALGLKWRPMHDMEAIGDWKTRKSFKLS